MGKKLKESIVDPQKLSLMEKDYASALSNLARYVHDPVSFGREVLGSTYEPYQEKILNALGKNKRVAWRAGHGVGKSYVASDAVLWFLFTRPNSKIITTASNWRQVNHVLWPEIHAHLKRLKFEKIGWAWPIDALDTMIKVTHEWFASGESSDDAQKLEGFHADHIMYVVDEAKLVPAESFSAIEGALNVGEGKMLVISTPSLNPSGFFYDLWDKPKSSWKTFHTSCYESSRVDPDWINSKLEEWGKDSIQFQARVLGEFPDQGSEDTLIPRSWINAAMDRDLEKYPHGSKIIFGVDVARKGSNESVVAVGCQSGILDMHVFTKQDLMQVAGWVITLARKFNPHEIRVDCDGVGGGVYDRLKELKQPVVEMHSSSASSDKERFANARAEWWFQFKDLLKPEKEGAISLPRDDKLLSQLSTITYGFTSKGQFKIESKDDLEKRDLVSPDRADAVVYAMCSFKKSRSAVVSPTSNSAQTPDLINDGNQSQLLSVQNGILLQSNNGGLPVPVQTTTRYPRVNQPNCPECGEILSIHRAHQWYCPKDNLWVRTDKPYTQSVILGSRR